VKIVDIFLDRRARQYFSLPASIRCEVADGEAFLQSNTAIYDAVVLDAYHGDRIPSHLRSIRFFQAAQARLAQRGAIFATFTFRTVMTPALTSSPLI
jgi:spermidine synthase